MRLTKPPLRVVLFLSMVIWIKAAGAQSVLLLEEEAGEWFTCTSDDDCVYELGVCYGPGAVNKRSLEEFRRYKKAVQPTTLCMVASADTPTSAAVVCKSQRCEVAKPPVKAAVGAPPEKTGNR